MDGKDNFENSVADSLLAEADAAVGVTVSLGVTVFVICSGGGGRTEVGLNCEGDVADVQADVFAATSAAALCWNNEWSLLLWKSRWITAACGWPAFRRARNKGITDSSSRLDVTVCSARSGTRGFTPASTIPLVAAGSGIKVGSL